MMRGVLAAALAGVLLWSASATAENPATTLYDDETLATWGERYARSSERILREGLFPELEPEEYRALASVELAFPARGEDLIGFYAAWPPPRIVLPVVSLKLLDDLSIAYAWLKAEGHSFETVDAYVAMLRYKPQATFPGGVYPTPFEALGIPADAIDDPEVDGLSLRFFNSARAFILAHELAHILYRHEGRGPQVLQDEIAADRFALDLLARTGTVPMGMIFYFQAMAQWSPNRAQFQSDAAWHAFVAEHRTHPLSGERIAQIAKALDDFAPAFAKHDADAETITALLRDIAGGLSVLVDYLEDHETQLCVGETAAEADLALLAPRPIGTSVMDCAD